MSKPRVVVWIFLFGMLIVGVGPAIGQDYPNRPIRIVTSPAGGGGDFTTRLLAQGLTGTTGWSVVVDNRPSAIVGEILARATPDGYTVLIQGSNLWLAQFMQEVPYDTLRDFAPVTMGGKSPSILVVHPTLPVKTTKELIALAKAKPGALNYASGPTASSPHLGAELFKSMAGVNVVRVAYKGGGPALTGLLGAEVQLMVASAGSVTAHIGSNRLRGLAVTSAEPSALAPGLPTVAASGIPGYELISPDGIFVPAKTPTAIITRLNQEIVRALNRSDVKEKFFSAGAETVGNSPKEFAAFVKSDMATLGKVIKDAGIKAE